MTETDGLWVRSDVAPDGNYIAVVEFSDDESRALDRTAAIRYATTVLAAVAAAEYDAAVVHQMTSIGMGLDVVGQVLTDLRHKRPSIDDEATWPIVFQPGVSHRDGRGFLTLVKRSEPVGQLELDAARSHALHVLEVIQVAELDRIYHRLLTKLIGVDDQRARAVVADLGEHRA
jgi:hypothetical protein